MTGTIADHDRFDVYRLGDRITDKSSKVAKDLCGVQRHARDQFR
jgi:hypothetical protein